jgi:nucleoside-diphosphate-sugar epimerase
VKELLRTAQPNIVFHLSALSSAAVPLELVEPTFDSIVLSTKNLLVAAALHGTPRVVLAGSFEEPALGEVPASPYAVAKAAAAAYGRMFDSLYGVSVITARCFMTYGPGQHPTKLFPHVIRSLLRGISPKLASGRRRLDWIYVEDVIAGMIAAATAPGMEGRTVDLGTGRLTTVREAIETIVGIMTPAVQPEFGAIPDRPAEPSRAADVEATAQIIGWRPRTSLEEGLARTIAWYRDHLDDDPGATRGP